MLYPSAESIGQAYVIPGSATLLSWVHSAVVTMRVANLFQDLPAELPEELTEILHQSAGVRIERIVSRGQSSPAGFWYDQDETEWVVVLAGRARLAFASSHEMLELRTGDHVLIPPHQKHRVDWTDPDQETIWLAIFHR